MPPSAFAAVKHELLVRYLDAWTPAALPGHKKVCLVVASASPTLLDAAFGVFAELADLLAGRTLTVVTSLPFASSKPLTPGIQVAAAWSPSLGLPFGVFDEDPALLAAVAAVKGAEVLAFGSQLPDPPSPYRCRAILVARDGREQQLLFGAATEKSLEKFKDELWALDEFAGAQLRDPADLTAVDISLQPNVGPLRHILADRVAAGDSTVAALRAYTLRHTIYRTADATRAIQAMLATTFARSPAAGRLTAETTITAISQSAA